MPETDRLDRAVAARIAAYRPADVPPFTAVEGARRRRRRTRVGAGAAGLAALAVAGMLAVPAVLQDPAPTPGSAVAAPPTRTTPPPPTTGSRPVPPVVRAQELWRTKGARSYTIKVQLLCFCNIQPPRLVTVVRGRTVGDGPNVDDLFATITSREFDKVTATYDPVYGFPTRVVVDPELNTVDEERTFVVTDYRPAP